MPFAEAVGAAERRREVRGDLVDPGIEVSFSGFANDAQPLLGAVRNREVDGVGARGIYRRAAGARGWRIGETRLRECGRPKGGAMDGGGAG